MGDKLLFWLLIPGVSFIVLSLRIFGGTRTKEFLRRLVADSEESNRWGKRFQSLIIALIWLSVIAICLESFRDLERQYFYYFKIFEVFTVSVFTIEYLIRLFTADQLFPERNKIVAVLFYIVSPLAIIDLLAILPFFLPMFIAFDLRILRLLRMIRLVRIFKLGRYSTSLRLILDVLKEKKEDLGVTIFITLVLLILASALMFHLEHEGQPDKFPNILASFWWAIATLTTVGYGDVYPITNWGKFISGIIALLGIGLVALPTGILSSAFIERMSNKKEEEEKKQPYNYCPHCGKPLPHD